ncbi:hypothetical protein [Mucilaginibacter rubeus]|uniref:Uncharacterized protein n=1 Tax=Mucilaginibacter rubeus TaxID=2027860 RepID=A0A5C1I6N4_9SPHI|nr:hypothetical protein [Mucilaginibacter rubeus]QEM13168.1 hypothetical protein DEO27_025210 [Mucilaginibacter rubeus]
MNEKICGYIMPISGLGKYTEQHWQFIKKLLDKIVGEAGFGEAEIVSYDPVSLNIKETIFNNIFTIPIVICDVSGYNPNVLFELGLRVGFDMPVLIIKDKSTEFKFDLSSYNHVIYPDEIESLEESQPEYLLFHNTLLKKLVKMKIAYDSDSPVLSPLTSYLSNENYLKVKRGVPFNIKGTYEYICYRTNVGYSHGGLCDITMVNSFGNLIDWQLQGRRCWMKASKLMPLQLFKPPYQWDTQKAIIFHDRSFILNYKIETEDRNIIGVIYGKVEARSGSNQIDSFQGHYHQDSGGELTKGRYKMVRINPKQELDNYKFQLRRKKEK